MLGHKIHLNKFKRTESATKMYSLATVELKSEINRKNISPKNINKWPISK